MILRLFVLLRNVLHESRTAAILHFAGFHGEVDAKPIRPALARFECIGSSLIARSIHIFLLIRSSILSRSAWVFAKHPRSAAKVGRPRRPDNAQVVYS